MKKTFLKHEFLTILVIFFTVILYSCDSSNSKTNTYSTNTEADNISEELPNTFVSQAKFITIGTDMELYDVNDNYYGVVEERTMRFTRTFEYYDKNNKLIAKASKEMFSWGTKIDIEDPNGKPIGYIEQQVFDSFFSLYSKYKIYDANHKFIASSDKLDFFSSEVWIEGNGISINMDQESFTLVDTWETTITGNIDKRLIVFIPAFVSAAQTERK